MPLPLATRAAPFRPQRGAVGAGGVGMICFRAAESLLGFERFHPARERLGPPMIFRQFKDLESSTLTYLLATRRGLVPRQDISLRG